MGVLDASSSTPIATIWPRWRRKNNQTIAVRKELYDMYMSTPTPLPCPYDLAIHIRRGDVDPWMNHGHRWISNEAYASVVDGWLQHAPSATIGIYSEGAASSFDSVVRGRPNVHLVLNGDSRLRDSNPRPHRRALSRVPAPRSPRSRHTRPIRGPL